jgi:hypothetical protein
LNIKRIFLDLDDVLNDFTLSTLRSFGQMDSYDPAWGWDIVAACNAAHPLRKMSPEVFWGSLDRKFWASRPKSGMCDWLIEESVRIVGADNVFVLTAPTRHPDCVAGKMEWVHENLPDFLHRQCLYGSHKYVCAQPASLLIDDCDANVDDFILYGGQACLVPRPWNTQCAASDSAGRRVSRALTKFRIWQPEEEVVSAE